MGVLPVSLLHQQFDTGSSIKVLIVVFISSTSMDGTRHLEIQNLDKIRTEVS
jgi:hypothetical protein